MKILSIREYEKIISWMPEGKSFFVHDKKKLNDILTLFSFQSTKYDSFRRKLHRWGFKIVKKGSSSGAYYHKVRQFAINDVTVIVLNFELILLAFCS